MMEEGITMIFLPESIKRILERIEEAYKRDIMRRRAYYSSISKNGKTYKGTDTVKFQLESFQEFKASLENGTSPLLTCEEGKEDEAKIRLMHAVYKWFEPLGMEDIYRIKNDVYIQRGLKSRIKKLSKNLKTKEESLCLLRFLNYAYASSWGQEDENYEVRDFRLVESEEEFEKILKKYRDAEDLTANEGTVDFTTIRVALVPIDEVSIYKDKGIWEEYRQFIERYLVCLKISDLIKMFNLWHDVRETAIYYIYVPK